MHNVEKSLILTKRWYHHTPSGGYDKLADYLPGEKVMTGKNFLQNSSFLLKLWNYLIPSSRSVNHYTPKDLYSEIKAYSKIVRGGVDIIHALYAEDQLNFLLKLRKKLDCKLIGTFHMPFESEYVQRAISRNHYYNFKKLDAAIVVSQSMVDDISKWIREDKVFVVHHGIDTKTFRPGFSEQRPQTSLKLLSVGHHGRDWQTILEIVKILMTESDRIVYNIVVPSTKRYQFVDLNNVYIHSEVSEKTLINLYQEADVLLLPVHFGTANNTILESLACGTPVISSRVGGIPEYVDDDSGWLFERGDAEGIAYLIKRLIDNPSLHLSKRDEARKKALSFEWSIIARKIQKIYSTIV